MSRVYVANFGQGNSLWPQCLANSSLATFNDVSVHDYWRKGDREGFISTALTRTFTARGVRPTRPTAGDGSILSENFKTAPTICGSADRGMTYGGHGLCQPA